jgi:hypothetical protein
MGYRAPHASHLGLNYAQMADDYSRFAPRRSVATLLGGLATIAWLALWAFAIWGDYTAAALVKRTTALTLGEWGTLAAAIIAPIGVLWLVLAYSHQADALARNTAMLWGQQAALREQIQETAMLVQEYARQTAAATALAELEIAAHRRHEDARRALLAPDFRFAKASFSAGHGLATVAMVNVGGTAYGLRFQSDDFADGKIKPSEIVERNSGFSLHATLDPMLRNNGGTFTIRCRDIEGNEHAFAFRTRDGAIAPLEGAPNRAAAA